MIFLFFSNIDLFNVATILVFGTIKSTSLTETVGGVIAAGIFNT
jgi:hypothetical protein